MFVAFLARHRPDSTHPKPAFIQKTRKAVTSTQMVSSATFKSAGEGPSPLPCAKAVAVKPSARQTAMAIRTDFHCFMIHPSEGFRSREAARCKVYARTDPRFGLRPARQQSRELPCPCTVRRNG